MQFNASTAHKLQHQRKKHQTTTTAATAIATAACRRSDSDFKFSGAHEMMIIEPASNSLPTPCLSPLAFAAVIFFFAALEFGTHSLYEADQSNSINWVSCTDIPWKFFGLCSIRILEMQLITCNLPHAACHSKCNRMQQICSSTHCHETGKYEKIYKNIAGKIRKATPTL